MVFVLLIQFLELVFDNHNELSSFFQIVSIYSIWRPGGLLCQMVSKELYISDRVQIVQSIYLAKANFWKLILTVFTFNFKIFLL